MKRFRSFLDKRKSQVLPSTEEKKKEAPPPKDGNTTLISQSSTVPSEPSKAVPAPTSTPDATAEAAAAAPTASPTPAAPNQTAAQKPLQVLHKTLGGSDEQADFELKAVNQVSTAQTLNTLRIALRNDSNSTNVFAYITGRAIDNGNRLVLIQADGRTQYFPVSPPSTQSPLQQNVAIPLGKPGQTIVAQVPRIAGGRVWFSVDGRLTFLLNPGPALVEPSVANPSDPSAGVNWSFCEFTYNSDQLYANISYVDFISVPISLSLIRLGGARQYVSGIGQNGLTQIADGLRAQNAKDKQGWDQLIIPTPGNPSKPLRVLSPNIARVRNPALLSNYWDGYVNQVAQKFVNQTLTIDTQVSYGVVTGHVPQESINSGNAVFNIGSTSFVKPSSADIWTCDTGPFATGTNGERNAIIPRLSAAFNRSTLLNTNFEPAPASLYYQADVTNHYSRIVHAANLDRKGYTFPYDDVQPTGGNDASGKVQAGDPLLWTIAIGGSRAGANFKQ